MGQTLSEPVTIKVSDSGEDDRYYYGVSSMQGWRVSMEDAHSAVLDMAPDSGKRIAWFAVYDGHGGDRVAKYAGGNVHQIVRKQEAFLKEDYVKALQDGFIATDTALLEDRHYEDEPSGCTATAVLITDKNVLYVANAGDSRTVLGRKGHAIPLSKDHKPYEETEKARITAAGGFVDFGRVNGNLALSRAIGDFDFKKSKELDAKDQIVTAFPDVKENELDDWDEFIVLACDGIWDCLTNAQVVEFVRRGIADRQELHKIAENLMDNCLAPSSDGGGYGCDNMTVIIVALLHGNTKEQWYDMVAERVKNKDGPVAPKKFARALGPGFNQFQNWNNRNEESSDDNSDGEEKPNDTKKPQVPDDDEEGWTSWKNGDDVKNRFSRKNKPGRIIHLGDGSELFTDRAEGSNQNAHDEHNMSTSSEDEDSDEEEIDKMQTDGIKPTSSDAAASPKPSEPRFKSPAPTTPPAAPQSPGGQ